MAADVAHRDALGDGGAADGDGLPGQGLRQGGVGFDLDADHLQPRAQRGGDGGAPGDHAATAHGHQQDIERPGVLQQFQRERALPGHDGRVVIGVDENQAVLRCQGAGMRMGFRQGLTFQDHAGAPGGGSGHLGGRREAGHHDGGVDAGQAGMACHGLGVVARRHGDHAGLPFHRRQQRQSVGRPALLERADDLQVLELQNDVRAGGQADGVGRQSRRTDHPAGDPLGRLLHVG